MTERVLKIVAAGVMVENGLVLLSQRRAHEHLAGVWEFPGGKLLPDEDPRECVKRELLEELGIEVTVGACDDVLFYRYEDFNVLLMFFRCAIVNGKPTPIEVNDVKWFTPQALAGLSVPPADQPLIGKLLIELAP